MSREHLVCAHCGAPVTEGRCPVCRLARTELQQHAARVMLAWLALALAVLAVILVSFTVSAAHA
jgi:hypothetical protein